LSAPKADKKGRYPERIARPLGPQNLMDNSTGAVSGDATAGSTAPADQGSDQSSVTQGQQSGTQAADTSAADNTDADVDLEAQAQADAEAKAAQQDQDDKSTDTAKDDNADAQAKEGESDQTDDVKPTKKAVVEQRKQIGSLESQLKPLREIETKVMEIGGVPVLEMAQPVVDTLLNPASTGMDVIKAVAAAAPHLSEQDIAWDVVEGNQDAVVQRYFGDDMTPDVLEKLVEKYKTGEIDLDGSSEDADEIFLTPKQKADREKVKAAEAREAAAAKAERDSRQTQLQAEMQASAARIATTCESAITRVLQPMAVKDDDTPEIKTLKETINKSVDAIVKVELATDPTWMRIQGLMQKNGFKAAESLAGGRLAMTIEQKAAEVFQKLQPLVTAAVGSLQKQAKKIQEVRRDPTGATTQSDATQKKEITAQTPNWRSELDKEFEGRLANIGREKARNDRGQFV
jgi:hypothetical protein